VKTIAAGTLARITERLGQLILEGRMTMDVRGGTGSIPMGEFDRWRLAALSFLENVFGSGNRYHDAFSRNIHAEYSNNCQTVEHGVGILQAAKRELDFGPLPRIEGRFPARSLTISWIWRTTFWPTAAWKLLRPSRVQS
jgi:hypothetical protein